MRVFAPSILLLATGCQTAGAGSSPEASVPTASASAATATPSPPRLPNAVAYIPSQCFTKTRTESGAARNPCYACHGRSQSPNYANDADLQTTLTIPPAALKNPWTNLFTPPVAKARATDDEVLRYVRESNYFDRDGHIVLANPPASWDLDGDGAWGGFRPDVQFAFDDRGFDRRPDGSPTGWRAFAYYPFPGTFFPTNGSTDDVLIRLAPVFQERADGTFDEGVYMVNLAIVESLVTRSDTAIDPVDEEALGVDLDLDGRMGRATKVVFDRGDGKGGTRMRYAGRTAGLPIAPGLFPLGTEFVHSVRYLDVGDDGVVRMAARMKELRYAKKAKFLSYPELEKQAAADAREAAESPNGARRVIWRKEHGIDNGQGWFFQGYIEDATGALRPQSREESSYCGGCHGGIGVTTDSIFSFPRKLGTDAAARGWFHWSQHGLAGLPEPRRRDGRYEYSLYLQETGAGDEHRENAEVLARFFDAQGALRPAEIEALHHDVARLLLPSAGRALDLDRAYRAIVEAQSFVLGRDAVLAPARNVYDDVPIGQKTGIVRPVELASIERSSPRR
jgi:hypothetical protein